MKPLYLILFFCLLGSNLQAQYQKAYTEGKRREAKQEYYDAILAYNAAYNTPDKPATNDLQKRIDFCATQLKKQQEEIKLALKKAKEEKERANLEKNRADSALVISEKSKMLVIKEQEKTDSALKVAKSIVDAMYFYEGKFALAYNGQKYGYIDKRGKTVVNFKYNFALPFDKFGFAKVQKVKNNDYYFLIDTTGYEYLLAENVNDLNSESEALFLDGLMIRNAQLSNNNIYSKIFQCSKLKVLSITKNISLSELPNSIKNLNQLVYLNLTFNDFSIFPIEIEHLKKLNCLILNNNYFHSFPKEIGNLKNLEKLQIRYNKINSIPDSIPIRYSGQADPPFR